MPWIIYVQDKGDNKSEAMINMSYFTSKEDLLPPYSCQVAAADECNSALSAQETSNTIASLEMVSDGETKGWKDR